MIRFYAALATLVVLVFAMQPWRTFIEPKNIVRRVRTGWSTRTAFAIVGVAVVLRAYDCVDPLFQTPARWLKAWVSILPLAFVVILNSALGLACADPRERWLMFRRRRVTIGVIVGLAAIGLWLAAAEAGLGLRCFNGLAVGLGWGIVEPRFKAAVVLLWIGVVTFEEILFRGVLFGAIEARAGGQQATIATAVMFGVFHCHRGFSYGLLTALAGVLFGLCRWKSGEVSAPIAMHFGWNLVWAV